jgi:hypothetical protein
MRKQILKKNQSHKKTQKKQIVIKKMRIKFEKKNERIDSFELKG